MDLSYVLQMASTLGQITQARIVFPGSTLQNLGELLDVQMLIQDEFQIIILLNLETNLFAKISAVTDFLEKENKHEQIKEVEVDIGSMETIDEFTVLINSDNEIILLNTTAMDKIRAKDQIQIDWIKAIC